MKSLLVVAPFRGGSSASRRPLARLLGVAPAVLLMSGLTAVWAGPLASPVAATTSFGTVVAWGSDTYGEADVPAGLSGVIAIGVGLNHSLAVKSDGTVVAWGRDDDGQTDVPAGLSGVVAVAGGDHHSLALKSDGTVVAWGADGSGQTDVPAGLSGVIAIAAGANHSLALQSDGMVVGWGADGSGQTNVPNGLVGVTAITACADHSAAVRADGSVFVWGADTYLSPPSGLGGVTAVASGWDHIVALKSDGKVVAWGDETSDSEYGQLTISPDLSGVTAVAAGGVSGLALKSDGTLYTWGDWNIDKVNPPAGLSGVTAIAAVSEHFLALRSGLIVNTASSHVAGAADSLTVTALGADGNADPGYVGTVHFTSSDPAATLPADYTFSAGDAGVHTFAAGLTLRTAGHQWVRGTDSVTGLTGIQTGIVVTPVAAASLGITTTMPYAAGVDPSATVTARDPYGNVATGYLGTVHITSSDPAAVLAADYTFTPADAGVHRFRAVIRTVGDQWVRATDTATPAITGVVADPVMMGTVVAWGGATVPDGLSNVVAMDSGFALRADGTVVAWGNDDYGQTDVPAGLSDIVAIASGCHHRLVLRSNGTIVAWGDDAYGAADVPAGLSGVVAIAAGCFHSVALKSDGVVVAWGEDDDGDYVAWNPPWVLSGIIAIAAGGGCSLALRSNGSIVGWGDQSLDGETGVPGLSGIKAIARGGDHGLALTESGAVVSWANPHESGHTFVPAGLSGVTAISSAGGNNLALRSDGTVVAWGDGAIDPPAGLSGVISVWGSNYALVPDSSLAFSTANSSVAGASQTVTLTAKNAFGNTDAGYRGTVHFTSSDPAAVLPRDYTFTGADAGVHTFSGGLTLRTAGSQWVRATDTVAAADTGVQTGIAVTPGAARTLAFATVSSYVVGAAHTVTIKVLDSSGNTVTGYLGTIHFTSSDRAAVLPADHAFTAADAGVHAFIVRLGTVGTQWLRANDTVTASIVGSQSGIAVTAGTVKTLAVATVNPYVAGTAHSLTVTAKDAGGNTVTGYLGTIHLTSSDPAAVLPADYTFTPADAGVHRFNTGFTLKTAGSRSVTARDTVTASITGIQTITVTPGAARTLTVVTATSFVAGAAHTLTITARDAYGNVATGYLGMVHLTSSDPAAVLPANYTFTLSDAGVRRLTIALKTAGSRSVTATETVTATISGTQTGITVTPAAARTLTVSTVSPWVPGASHTVTITARDAYGNVATGYLGTIHVTSSDPAAVLPADYTFVVGDSGVHKLTVKLKTVGSQWIRATDTVTATITGSQTITVS